MILLAGCGTSKAAGTRAVGAATVAPSTTSAALGTVVIAHNPKLGAILADAAGMTLYRNTNESGPAIACSGSCTSIWPPLLVAAGSGQPTGAPGVTGTLSSIARPDGPSQVTYNGMPLYHFANDRQPGDTNGQGVGGIWFAVSPMATPTPTAPTTTTPTTVLPATTTVPTTGPAKPAAPVTTKPPATAAPTVPRKPSPTMLPPTSPPPTKPPPTTCLYPPCS